MKKNTLIIIGALAAILFCSSCNEPKTKDEVIINARKDFAKLGYEITELSVVIQKNDSLFKGEYDILQKNWADKFFEPLMVSYGVKKTRYDLEIGDTNKKTKLTLAGIGDTCTQLFSINEMKVVSDNFKSNVVLHFGQIKNNKADAKDTLSLNYYCVKTKKYHIYVNGKLRESTINKPQSIDYYLENAKTKLLTKTITHKAKDMEDSYKIIDDAGGRFFKSQFVFHKSKKRVKTLMEVYKTKGGNPIVINDGLNDYYAFNFGSLDPPPLEN